MSGDAALPEGSIAGGSLALHRRLSVSAFSNLLQAGHQGVMPRLDAPADRNKDRRDHHGQQHNRVPRPGPSPPRIGDHDDDERRQKCICPAAWPRLAMLRALPRPLIEIYAPWPFARCGPSIPVHRAVIQKKSDEQKDDAPSSGQQGARYGQSDDDAETVQTEVDVIHLTPQPRSGRRRWPTVARENIKPSSPWLRLVIVRGFPHQTSAIK